MVDQEPEPAAPSTPRKCTAHGLAAGHRSDGRPNCPLCRREQATTRLAPVYPLRSA